MPRPPLTVELTLSWADRHRERHGRWPSGVSRVVPGKRGERWFSIDHALRHGYRGLPGGSSLARLLAEHRGARNKVNQPKLTVRQILEWAEAHHARTGHWPSALAGPVQGEPGEAWRAIDDALSYGRRGLPGGDSLARLLARRKGARTRTNCPPLTERQVLAWCDAHFVHTGHWPRHGSGPIVGATGETWLAVDTALRKGKRGLLGGDSLFLLLRRHRDIPGPRAPIRRRERGAGSRAIIRLNLPAELLERFRRGELTIGQVAAKCGVGLSTAARELKRAKAKSRGPGRPARKPEHARILRLYRMGHTLSAVARAVSWSPYRVRGLLRRSGVTLRPQGDAPALGLTPSGRVRFGRRLRKRRLACGLTQKQLAARCGVHALAIVALEKGRYSPLRRTVLRLAEALRVQPEGLLGRRKIMLRDDGGTPPG